MEIFGSSWEQEKRGEMQEVFRDGQLLIDYSLAEIRERVKQKEYTAI